MAIVIRPAILEDATSIAENIKTANTTEEVLTSLQLFQKHKVTHLVADEGRRVVANALLIRSRYFPPGEAHRGELSDFVVHPDHQGTGLARRLLEAISDEARAQGMTQLEIAASSGNPHAEDAYRGLGFTEWGFLPNANADGGMTFFYLPLASPSSQPSSSGLT